MKSVAEGLAAAIPEIEKVVKLLINLFWPETKESIWSAIKEQVEKLVETKILDFELQERTAALNALRDNMKMYTHASNDEKASLMSAILVSCNQLYEELTSSDNAIHLIPITISHCYLHLTMLRERFEHGFDMYPDAKDSHQWEKELTSKVNDYKAFFLNIYPKWREWRRGEVRVSTWQSKNAMLIPPFFNYTAHGETKDDMTEEVVSYQDDMNSIEDYFKPLQNRAKDRMFHEADAKMMMEAYHRTFSLDVFFPGNCKDEPKADPTVGDVSYGPYSFALESGSHRAEDSQNIYSYIQSDNCGVITKIYVWAWNTVDRIQFCYENRGMETIYGDDTFDDKPALKNEIILDGKYVIGAKLAFSLGLLAKIQFHFNDGTSSPFFGKFEMDASQEFKTDGKFRMTGAEARCGSGPSSTRGVAEIKFMFRHISLTAS